MSSLAYSQPKGGYKLLREKVWQNPACVSRAHLDTRPLFFPKKKLSKKSSYCAEKRVAFFKETDTQEDNLFMGKKVDKNRKFFSLKKKNRKEYDLL